MAKVPLNETLLSVHEHKCQSLVPAPPPGSQFAPVPCKRPLISSTEGMQTAHYHQ